VAEPPLAFHAAAPAGEWLNDPNGLIYSGGAYRLFAQHRNDGPAFTRTGWARLSSPDLLHWQFDGVAIPPAGEDWMYSGCVVEEGGELQAVHTMHAAGLEQQVRRWSGDSGASWSEPRPARRFGRAKPQSARPVPLSRW
jgi:sucrose-6-phosphate hydrolase SacC (GH32 family)